MSKVRNILFIMCDQLRWDYLSCSGHPHLKTPNIDWLAENGVRFTNAYVQSPVCGSSRMSFYTGRYVQSHGANWNGIPLKVGEMTMGDYLRPQGMQTALVGKTHMCADKEGMRRMGIDPDSIIGVRIGECGFDPYERDDGLHGQGPDGWYNPESPLLRYNQYLRNLGYKGENPWNDWANSAEDEDGTLMSGWLNENAHRPARVAEEHSETPYMTRRAMDFIREAGEDPWCLHLSYIKPHWPYIAPAPYHSMYGKDQVVPAIRSETELNNPHPVYYEFTQHKVGQSFSNNKVRQNVIPTYMGLIKQIDDQLGQLWQFLKEQNRADDTLIVFTSDHGDYLGDHWLGEKDLFHDASVKVPLIVFDPSQQADETRGTTCEALVESIDLLPTFVELAGGSPQAHRLEGLSLMPWIRGDNPAHWRKNIISEYDYSLLRAAEKLDLEPNEARLFMVFDGRYKYIHAPGFRPMLYDLDYDPEELKDLGDMPEFQNICSNMHSILCHWGLRNSQRVTRSDDEIKKMRGKVKRKGILIGFWEADELPAELFSYHKQKKIHRSDVNE